MQKEQIEVLQVKRYFGGRLEVRQVTKEKAKRHKESGKMQIDNFGNEKCDTKYVCANGECSFGGEIEKITVGKLRGLGKLYNLEEETEITEMS